MQQFIYAIKDSKIGTFGKPFFVTHEAIAIRECNEVVLDQNTMVGKYPEDFELWKLGLFDDEGEFLDTKPKFVVSFKTLQEKADLHEQGRNKETPTKNLQSLRSASQGQANMPPIRRQN